MDKYNYKAFGFQIYSEVPISKFIESKNKENDVYIKYLEHKPQLEQVIHTIGNISISQNSFLLDTGSNCFYYQHDEKTLLVKKTNEQLFEQYLCGPVFALICAFNGKIPLHASGVILNNKQLLISGNSGSGKSTMLYYLIHKYNATFIADDLIPLKKVSDEVYSLPAFPEIKLWLDTVEYFKAKIIESVHPEIKKFYVQVNEHFQYKKQIPNIILIIQRSLKDTMTIEKIVGIQKFLLLSEYVYRKKIVEAVFMELAFTIISSLAKQTDIYLIKRPYKLDTSNWENGLDNFIKEKCLS